MMSKRDILNSDDLGLQAYNQFVNERIMGTKCLWDKMTKLKLKTFSSKSLTARVKTKNQTVELKENRSLFARLAIVARSRPDINMEEAISTFEFSCVSRALFAPDGSELPCNDKSNLTHILEALVPQEHEQPSVPRQNETEDNDTALVIDAMVLVQEIGSRKDKMSTCKELAASFVSTVDRIANNYESIHVIFDHYNVEASLKEKTR